MLRFIARPYQNTKFKLHNHICMNENVIQNSYNDDTLRHQLNHMVCVLLKKDNEMSSSEL